MNNTNTVIVIPGEGCGGCITGATFFVKDNINRMRNVAIIFTGVQDKKLLRNQLGSTFMSKPYVFTDDNNSLMNKEVLSMYPYILQINNSEITLKEDFSEEKIKLY